MEMDDEEPKDEEIELIERNGVTIVTTTNGDTLPQCVAVLMNYSPPLLF